MSTLGVGIFGIGGKMGSEVRRAVTAAEDMEVTGGADLGEPRERIGDAAVAVDFTHPDAVMDNIEWCVPRGINMVIGTTGFNEERLARVRELCAANPGVGVLVASNFSIGAVLMMQFAAKAAPFYPSAEIVELHHPNKADAPSGTSATTAGKIAAARAAAGHGVRLQGLVAHQEVLFGTHGETLTIRHDSFDRASFMPGVLAGVRWVIDHPGLTEGIETIIGL